MRTVLAGAVLSLIAIAAFSFTPLGANVASVVGAGDTIATACLTELVKLHPAAHKDVVEISKADLNDDGTDDRLVKLTDETSCGTNGCVHEICLQQNGDITLVAFGYAANELTVLSTKTNGLYDLALNGSINLTWDGERYALAE